ncbi:MAG: hypothetical protein QM817_24715 [Archangium sp.]
MSNLNALRWDSRILQKKLKKLGVPPPPPKGKPVQSDIMKPGKFYVPGAELAHWEKYNALLTSALETAASQWTSDAYGHNVMVAALDAASGEERPEKPHGHVAARPVIDNHGYLRAAILAAEAVEKLVPKADQKRFTRLLELGRRVALGRDLTDADESLLDAEMPFVRLPSRAVSRQFTATGPLRVAQGVALDAVEAAINNVAGKGAREACAQAVRSLTGKARPFLEKLDALILREDARLQFEKVAVKPSSPVVASRWRGAEKGKGSHWIAELQNGSLALLWKVKGKWRLVEGSRDDVLACVSDSHLRAATDALLGAK